MLLWTIQHYAAFEKLIKNGVLHADDDFLFCENDFRFAYDFIADKMIKKGLKKPDSINYPIWAWYKWNGFRKRRDMRNTGLAMAGTEIVQLTIDICENDVLLSDFNTYHYVLGYFYLPLDENDDNRFEKKYTELGFELKDLNNFSIQNNKINMLRSEIENSWDRILDLNLENDGFIYGLNNKKCIQATFWELKLSQVIKAEYFIAR